MATETNYDTSSSGRLSNEGSKKTPPATVMIVGGIVLWLGGFIYTVWHFLQHGFEDFLIDSIGFVFCVACFQILALALYINSVRQDVKTFEEVRSNQLEDWKKKVATLSQTDLLTISVRRRCNLISGCLKNDIGRLVDVLPYAIELDIAEAEARLFPLAVYSWMLPVFGFVGTTTGMASAISSFQYGYSSASGQIDQLTPLFEQVTKGLSTAFHTTIIALAATIVVYFCSRALRLAKTAN